LQKYLALDALEYWNKKRDCAGIAKIQATIRQGFTPRHGKRPFPIFQVSGGLALRNRRRMWRSKAAAYWNIGRG
jgi:hypothetical protein